MTIRAKRDLDRRDRYAVFDGGTEIGTIQQESPAHCKLELHGHPWSYHCVTVSDCMAVAELAFAKPLQTGSPASLCPSNFGSNPDKRRREERGGDIQPGFHAIRVVVPREVGIDAIQALFRKDS